ncbi:WD repeat and FYVE domain-containing protein [Fasciola gigantica]|uniref:WD repeat and FYVE domain-containing protein n=1 Tax=Fasciola gigantica TaxID=46835 RepID=A0A504YYJ7_FASGI|nr:WD repeat and FYVE domain-containing protein [Fasciola gigantica]
MAAVIQDPLREARRPELIFKIDGFGCDVHDAIFLPDKDAIVTGTEDRTLRIWMRRDTGRFWPSAIEVLPSPVTCITYCSYSRRLYVGLDNGTVVELLLAEDLNHMEHKRDYLSHTARIDGVIIVMEMKWILSVSRDRTFAWYSNENGKRLGGHDLESAGTCLEFVHNYTSYHQIFNILFVKPFSTSNIHVHM